LERLSGPGPVWHVATVRRLWPENSHATSIAFGMEGWPGHRAGQHVDVRLTAEDGYQAQRSYSIASPPEADEVVLTVERLDDGEVSPYLVDVLREGDDVELRGPIGGPFTWSVADGGPLLLIGGGSGLVPLMAMLRHRAAHAADHVPARVLVSARAIDDVLYRAELEGMADVRITLTREQPGGWEGWSRRVDAAMLTELGPPPSEHPHTFICGPTAFVELVAGLLVDLGHAPASIRTERFGPTGT
jgi:ferredoxin-NADP reductase